MAGLGAEMRDVDHGGGIVGEHQKALAGCQRLQPLARLQHRQRAEQAKGVQCIVGVVHTAGIGAIIFAVHRDVTERPRDPARWLD